MEISDDIYSDTDFADFYNRSINEKFEINDLDFYREKINNDDVVLEIGSRVMVGYLMFYLEKVSIFTGLNHNWK